MSQRKRYITPEGFRRLEAEHLRLWQVERPRLVNEVATAAAHGDRSENAEYIYGKKRLREVDRRIRHLSKLMDRLTVVEQRRDAPEDRVFFGAWVTVEDEEGEAKTYRIVGPDELDAAGGLVSVDSPLARALLGKKVDDEVRVRRPRGEVDLVVVDIRYEEA